MLNPDIMIFEESGQVLESHVLSSLTPNLQRLILIRDHQQLKLSVSTYDLPLIMKKENFILYKECSLKRIIPPFIRKNLAMNLY